MSGQSLRLFIALELDDDSRKKIASFSSYLTSRKIPLSGLKLVDINNIHLTLFFLGDFFDEKGFSSFLENFKRIRFSRISFCFKEIGFFPDELRPRVLWISPDDYASEKIRELRENLLRELELYGFRDEEKKFKAHITIARIKDFEVYKRYIEFIKSFHIEGSYSFTSLTLFNSTLTSNGPIYKKISEVKPG